MNCVLLKRKLKIGAQSYCILPISCDYDMVIQTDNIKYVTEQSISSGSPQSQAQLQSLQISWSQCQPTSADTLIRV